MSRIGRDSGRAEAIHQLQAIHHAVKRSIAQFARRDRAVSAPQALSDSYLRGNLETLAKATHEAAGSGRLSESSLGGVAGLLSELNGVLAFATTLGEGATDSQREALQHRVNVIVGTIDRLSGGDAPSDSESALGLAQEIRNELLETGVSVVQDDPSGSTLDLSA